MTFSKTPGWVRNLMKSFIFRPRRLPQKPQRLSRPQVEPLEDRVTPSTWTVENANPAGAGSLFAAVSSANSDTSPALINFDPTFFSTPRTIPLPASLTLNNTTEPITIQGPTNVTVTISGDNDLQDVVVNSGVTAALQNLTLTQGNAGTGSGGAVDMLGGTLTINNCTISNNTANFGGGIYVGAGDLLLENSFITSNSNPSTASSGYGGGLCQFGGTVTVLGCLFTQNGSYVNFGGGDGGAIFAGGASMTVINSTFTGNAANTGEYSYSGGAIAAESPLTVVNSTITGNAAPSGGGGGIYNDQTTVNLVNDIVWSNTGSPTTNFASTNGSATVTSSLLGSETGANMTYGPADILNVPSSPSILVSLANNGGPTQTMAPVANSLPVGAAGNLTQLSSAISASVATLAVSNSAVFAAGVLPTLASGSYYTIQIGGEQMAVIGVSGSTLTVVRGANGTTAAAHAANAPIYLVSDSRGLLAPFSTSPAVDMGAVNSGAASGTGLSVYLQPPTTTTVNAGFSVAVLDVSGSTPVAGATISLSISSGTLNGTTTATTNASGVAVFNNLSVPSSAAYTLTALAGSLQATSRSFTIGSSTVPSLSAISQSSGSVSGGATVIITGANFSGATAVHFGATAASSFTVDSINQITAIAPAQAAGLVDITVTSPQGTSPTTASDQFSYVSSVTLVVTNTNAMGPGSLFSAVRSADVAPVPATIDFAPSVFNVAQTITLPTSLVLDNATQSVTLSGPTAATLTISGNSQNGALISDVIVVTGACTVQNLKLTQGNAGSGGGGGVTMLGGTVTIDNCTISSSTANFGGGIYVGAGDLLLQNSFITSNSNPSTASSGYGGGLCQFGGTVTVLGCLFTQNGSYVNFGGGDGGAIFAGGTSMTVINSTFTGNAANTGEYSYSGGAIAAESPITVVNSTITGNAAPSGGGGGIYNNQTTINLVNDIVWNNSGSPSTNFASTNGSVTASYSLLGSESGANFTYGSGVILNVPSSPSILGGLANNGGPTETMAPVADSLPVGAAGNVAQLSSAISASVATLAVSSSSVFAAGVLPTLASGSYYNIEIGSEQMAVIGANGSTLTVVRGINGTTATTHTSGASVYLVSDQRGDLVPANNPPVVDMGAYQTTGVNGIPSVTSVSPNNGGTGGGTNVTITGSGLLGATAVEFGGFAATTYTVNSNTQITATAPAGTAGTVDVTITTPYGTSANSSSDDFTYMTTPTVTGVSPSVGATGGGTTVTITGTSLLGTTAVDFGSDAATTYTVNSNTQITAISPAGSPGTVNVTVTSSYGTSATSNGDNFTYAVVPTVTGVSPSSGPSNGGTTVTVTGTNFTSATAVDFGSTPAGNVAVLSAAQITCTSPPGIGMVNVTVTTPAGTSATTSSDQFAYSGYVVTNTSNSASTAGSLPWCVAQANAATSNTVITFAAADFGGPTTITLAAPLNLSNTAHSVAINATGVGPVTVSGNNATNIVVVNSGVTAVLSGLILVDGEGSTQSGSVTSGSVTNSGTLTIDNCTVSGTVGGPALDNAAGTMTLNNCVLSGNSGSGAGAAISNITGTIVVLNTTMSGNSAVPNSSGNSSYSYNAGAVNSAGTATFINDTIANNQANGGGGLVNGGTMTILDSTVCDNTVNSTSSPVYGGGIYAVGVLNIINSTIADNTCETTGGQGVGGGIFADGTSLTLLNSVVSGNAASGSAPDIDQGSGTIAVDYSLIGNTSGSGITSSSGTGNVLNPPSAGLGTLGNNGGPTQTIPLVSGSPAIGAASSVTTVGTGGVNNAATSIPVTNGTIFAASSLPTLSSGSYCTIQIGSEQMAVIGLSGNTLTVVRGVNGTAASSHTPGAAVYLASDQRGYLVPANTPPVVDMGAYQTTGANANPSVTAVNPDAGGVAGGATVTITGTNFTGTTTVSFGSTAATSFTVNSNTQITAVDPAEAVGTVTVSVTTPLGATDQSASSQFAYVPLVTSNTADLPDNAASLTITGTGFDANPANDTVTFNEGVAGTVTAASATQLTVSIAVPPTALGSLTATVTTDGQSSGAALQVATVVNGDWMVTDPSGAAGSLTDVTLPYAVTHALNGDQITFASGLSGGTISLSSPLTIGSNVTITGPATGTVTLEGTVTVASGATVNEQNNLTIGAGGTLNVVGVLNIYGTVEISLGGSYYDEGTVNVETGGTLSDQDSITVTAGGILNDFGTVTEGAGGDLTIESGGTLNIYGNVTIEAGAAYSPLGTVNIEPGGVLYVAPAVASSTAGMLVDAPTLTILGAGFDPTAGNNTVTFNDGAVGTVANATATTLTVTFTTAPTAAGSLTAVVTTDSITSGAPVQVATVSFVNSVVVNADYSPVVDISSDGVSTVAVTTDGNNGFTAGNTVVISGYTGASAGYDGTFTVQSASGNQFTVTNTTPGLPSISGNSAGFAISQNTASTLRGNQRSMVDSVVYTFTSPISLTASNFTLTTSAPSVSGAPSAAPAPATLYPGMALTSLGDGSIWVVAWVSGGGSGATVTGHSLADGVYNITLDNSNESTDNFYRLYGNVVGYNSVNHTASLNNLESLQFTHTYLLSTGAALYLADMDYDANGAINNTDSLNFTHRYLSVWSGFMPTI